MNIYINGEKVDITLENEKTAGDVVKNIQAWLEENDYYISDIKLDGKQVYIDDTDWKEKTVSSVGRVDIESLDSFEMRVRHLSTVRDYFLMFRAALERKEDSVVKDLLSEYPFIIKNLSSILDSSNRDLITVQVHSLITGSGILTENELAEENRLLLISEWENMTRLLDGRIREIENPVKESENTLSAIQTLLPRAEEVALMLQTGKDREAMHLIIQLVELLQKIIRIIFFLKRDDNIKEENLFSDFAGDLNTVLTELEDAFQNEDTVLIGDLIEYELVPRLKKAPKVLERLKNS